MQCLKVKRADSSVERSREEAEMIACDAASRALEKDNCTPKHIHMFVIKLSLFSPAPNVRALVASKIGMWIDVQTYKF